MSSYIGYDNQIINAAITASDETSGYPKENAQTWKTSAWWGFSAATVTYQIDLGSAISIDSYGIAGHNLGDVSGDVVLQYSATGAFAGEEVNFEATRSPTDNATIFRKGTSQSYRYWQFKFSGHTGPVFIGNLFLGASLQLQREIPPPFSPANFNRDYKIYNHKTESGNYTGRAIRYKGNKVTIQQRQVTRAWMDSNWWSLVNHVELYPFYFLWSQDNYPDETAYCMANDIKQPTIPFSLHFDFSFVCTAKYD